MTALTNVTRICMTMPALSNSIQVPGQFILKLICFYISWQGPYFAGKGNGTHFTSPGNAGTETGRRQWPTD